ncbi:MAG: gluconolactonase [Verrucomicrobiota bacterium]|jgi:sugar lactone lactonase YvrE/enterochelin esterase-like enzyme
MRTSILCLPFIAITLATDARGADNYSPGADSKMQAGVPKGTVVHFVFDASKIFPGTTRDYWVYTPSQYDPAKPACVYICQDGIQNNAPVVFDNLIHKKEMPVTVGIFVTPGQVKAPGEGALDRFNRSYEYDGLGDSYARFLLEELLPDVITRTGLKLSTNANDRAIGGSSSGAVCAFTAAWERPDQFRRVFSSIGTYVGLRGGNNYPTLIRKLEPKPIRIFLQDGTNDLNIYGGDWWMANQEMERSLIFSGYAVNHAWGEGGHNGKQAGAIFPDAMRWLWKDWPAPVVANAENQSKQPVATGVLLPGEDWQVVSEGHKFTEGPAVNARGEIFFTDIPNNRIHKIGLDGKVTIFAEKTDGANGLMFGPDEKLYACANGARQIRAYDDKGESSVVTEGFESNDLCLNQRGDLYVTDPLAKQIWFIPKGGEKRVVDRGIEFPNGVVLSPDQSLLYVADSRGQFVWSYQVKADGDLAFKQRYFHLHLPDGGSSGADGMTVDTNGTLYVATALGVQFCDQAGRVNGIISKPQNKWLANLCFGGPNLDELYAACGDRIYKRKLRVRGATSFRPSIKPRAPRL